MVETEGKNLYFYEVYGVSEQRIRIIAETGFSNCYKTVFELTGLIFSKEKIDLADSDVSTRDRGRIEKEYGAVFFEFNQGRFG